MKKKELLRINNESVEHQGFLCIKNLYLELYEEEIAGILQRSDIEKTALIKLLMNSVKAYYIGEQPTLVREMSVADNFFTVRKGRGAKIYRKKIVYNETDRILKEFDINIKSNDLVDELQKTDIRKIELIKAYVQGYRAVIIQDLLMDYSIEDQMEFLRILTLLKKKKMSFIITDYNIDVLLRISDRILIIDNGRIGKTYNKEEFALCKRYFEKQEYKNTFIKYQDDEEGKKTEIFSAHNLCGQFLDNLSFSVYRGEIISLAKLSKNKRTELIYYLIGRRKIKEGTVTYKGKKYCPKSILQLKKMGINIVRMQILADSYLFDNLTVMENVYIGSIKKMSRAGVVSKNLCNFVKCEFHTGFFEKQENWDKTGEEIDTIVKWQIYLKRLELQNPDFLICEEIFAINDEQVDKIVTEFLINMKKAGTSILILSSNDRNLNKVSDRVMKY